MSADDKHRDANSTPIEADLGNRLRGYRLRRGYSLRTLADLSGLNINTLSLIENSKSSPSVGTLQQLTKALGVPLSVLFAEETVAKQVVFTPAHSRPLVDHSSAQMENLALDLAGGAVQPYMVTLKPGMGSGERMIVHTGHEFVYCLEGEVHYHVEEVEYLLKSGDSLVFQAHLRHCWENTSQHLAQLLIVLYPADLKDNAWSWHVSSEQEP